MPHGPGPCYVSCSRCVVRCGSGVKRFNSQNLRFWPENPLKSFWAKNIARKVKIPGVGRSSQIDSDDSVVIATLSTKRRSTVLRIDRQSGETIWNVEISCGPTKQQHKCDTGSSNLPATDCSRVNYSASARKKMGLPAVDWHGGIECATSACSNESEHGVVSPINFDQLMSDLIRWNRLPACRQVGSLSHLIPARP